MIHTAYLIWDACRFRLSLLDPTMSAWKPFHMHKMLVYQFALEVLLALVRPTKTELVCSTPCPPLSNTPSLSPSTPFWPLKELL